MIDTIHVLVPISRKQFLDARGVAKSRDRNVWALVKTAEHSIWVRNVADVATLKVGSYERDIYWSIPDGTTEDIPTGDGLFAKRESLPSPPYFLQIQASLPKLIYGHNISLLHDWPAALERLKDGFKSWFGWRSLPDIKTWKVQRCDLCMAWDLGDAATVMEVIELMKRLRYPHKRPRHYEGTAMWPATKNGGYSVKVYAKGLEFESNDLPKLLKGGASECYVNRLSERAARVLRFEITGKRRFLKRLNINTVEDIMGQVVTYEISSELMEWCNSIQKVESGKLSEPMNPVEVIPYVLAIAVGLGHLPEAEDGIFALDDGQVVELPQMVSPPLGADGKIMTIPAGVIRTKFQLKTEFLLDTYLRKLVGSGDMSNANEVKELLQRRYKGAKAGRLYSTWLIIQREGAQEAIDLLGPDAYYRDVRELKQAGVPLNERHGVLIKPGNDFWHRFRIEVPSPFVVNRYDDFPDHENLVNMAEWVNRTREAN